MKPGEALGRTVGGECLCRAESLTLGCGEPLGRIAVRMTSEIALAGFEGRVGAPLKDKTLGKRGESQVEGTTCATAQRCETTRSPSAFNLYRSLKEADDRGKRGVGWRKRDKRPG